jgi:ABC-type bacteriocin/lantibiotic exporter with double-glycine peptidase domain
MQLLRSLKVPILNFCRPRLVLLLTLVSWQTLSSFAEQIENHENSCAVAVTYFVLRWFNVDLSAHQVTESLGVGSDGVASLSDIKRVTETNGVYAAPLRINVDQLKRVALPCVIPIHPERETQGGNEELAHFVVVIGYSEAGGLKVADPTLSARIVFIPTDYLQEIWQGEALVFFKTAQELEDLFALLQ